MRIGIDFDNTIACYDGVFHAAALERDLIPGGIGTDKNSVRDHLNGSGQKDAFTELQGYVYGSRMDLAKPFPGVAEFICKAKSLNVGLRIVSHKTRFPILGPKHDMHDAARGFLVANGLAGPEDHQIDLRDVFFEETKQAKVATAGLVADAFIDDLPEILDLMFVDGEPAFPMVLFDPKGQHTDEMRFPRAESWSDISAMLLARNA